MIDHRQTLAEFARAANSTNFDQVAPLIDEEAVYWFTDGSFEGRETIRKAFEQTWATIRDEQYRVEDLRWLAISETVAVCIYRFVSDGYVEGRRVSATGRATNVLIKRDATWAIVHEHLSKDPDEK